MSQYHLAQLNIALGKQALDHPQMADFVAAVEGVNTLAESSPGFLWRLVDTPRPHPFGEDRMLVNLSLWKDLDSLKRFVYSGEHLDYMKRKKSWFDALDDQHLALWWVPAGSQPGIEEAAQKLQQLRDKGPSEQVFTFARPFLPPVTDSVS